MTAPSLPRLSVNVDHVATVRQARRVPYPDPVEAARIAEEAGAHGITVHLRQDRRHIQDEDVVRLAQSVRGKLNLEIAATDEMVAFATRTRPHQVTLVPERPEEVTTEGGLDLGAHRDRVQEAASALAAAGMEVSLFVDPSAQAVELVASMRDVEGFEINTDAYTREALLEPGSEVAGSELASIREAIAAGRESGLHVYAGHGLTVENVGRVVALGGIEELNIGHAIVARAVLIGLGEAVREMQAAIDAA